MDYYYTIFDGSFTPLVNPFVLVFTETKISSVHKTEQV